MMGFDRRAVDFRPFAFDFAFDFPAFLFMA
jgi:hypothetical protein